MALTAESAGALCRSPERASSDQWRDVEGCGLHTPINLGAPRGLRDVPTHLGRPGFYLYWVGLAPPWVH